MAKADLIYRDGMDLPDGHIVEMTIWRLPDPSDERPHGLKYSLFYGRRGERIIGHDNESGKGDHCHYRRREVRYVFSNVETLIADFLDDVRKERGEA